MEKDRVLKYIIEVESIPYVRRVSHTGYGEIVYKVKGLDVYLRDEDLLKLPVYRNLFDRSIFPLDENEAYKKWYEDEAYRKWEENK